ncbi:hypothetical protein N5923_13765 [Erwiniaceae bacterium BAC15a-03b]|uniref:Uncharacterized protein n=1 Tax=Winslowiella arboricola TaxID=2978220 RepID=A0A9J6PUU4_9GAMM|nr:hypothetical protein [Winslowiella arboricola]MCU5772108.1 hypothetical protein [Winslowiella arboricola]MCU5778556.1 hypothetical protein [Winslowiella arboricola]
MRKSIKVVIVVVVMAVAALAYTWPYIEMEFAGNAHYTEQDSREYNFYTPDILKKMPRISDRYDFDFANVTGPATHVYAIKFYDSEDTGKIDAWLTLAGYQRQSECDEELVCWRGADPQETVYVGRLKGEKTVIVQVVYDFT